MKWTVYLSGEIHTDWRQQIIDGCQADKLPVVFTSAVTDHDASDSAGDLNSTRNYLIVTCSILFAGLPIWQTIA